MTPQAGVRRKPKPGRILFVGSGPGDPGLLTTRARAVLANAALVFTDPDVPEQVLSLVGSELPPASGPAPAPEARSQNGGVPTETVVQTTNDDGVVVDGVAPPVVATLS